MVHSPPTLAVEERQTMDWGVVDLHYITRHSQVRQNPYHGAGTASVSTINRKNAAMLHTPHQIGNRTFHTLRDCQPLSVSCSMGNRAIGAILHPANFSTFALCAGVITQHPTAGDRPPPPPPPAKKRHRSRFLRAKV